MVLGKIVTNVEKASLPLTGFFSPSSSVEKLASIVSHFYKSLSSIVIPFTKECDIIFPSHLPVELNKTNTAVLTPLVLKLDQQLVREFGQSRCNPIGQRTKGSIFTITRPIVFGVTTLHLLPLKNTVFNGVAFFHTLVQLAACCSPSFCHVDPNLTVFCTSHNSLSEVCNPFIVISV